MYKCRKCNGTRMAIKPNVKNPAANKDNIRLYPVNSDKDGMTMEDYHVILVSLEMVLSYETADDFADRVRLVYRKMVEVMGEYL